MACGLPILFRKTSKRDVLVSCSSTSNAIANEKTLIGRIAYVNGTVSRHRGGLPKRFFMIPVHMLPYTIGVDLGGTNLRAAAVDQSGAMLDRISSSTNFMEGREAVLSDIVSAILVLRDRYGAAGLAGIGVGVPGFIRMKEGYIT